MGFFFHFCQIFFPRSFLLLGKKIKTDIRFLIVIFFPPSLMKSGAAVVPVCRRSEPSPSHRAASKTSQQFWHFRQDKKFFFFQSNISTWKLMTYIFDRVVAVLTEKSLKRGYWNTFHFLSWYAIIGTSTLLRYWENRRIRQTVLWGKPKDTTKCVTHTRLPRGPGPHPLLVWHSSVRERQAEVTASACVLRDTARVRG